MALLRRALLPLAVVLAGVLSEDRLHAQVLTQDEALALAFPDAEIDRRTAYLSADELREASELAGPGVAVEMSVVPYYVASRDGAEIGVAYFDSHRVRTLHEVLMIVLGLDGRVERVETVIFREPPEYEAPGRWLDVFAGRSLDRELSLKGSVPNITGATLTAGAVTRATRRVLALHHVIQPFGQVRP